MELVSSRPWIGPERIEQDWRLSVVTPPDALPVTFDEAKRHIRLICCDGDDPLDGFEDTLIKGMIGAAVDEIDSPTGWLGRSLVPRTLRLTLDSAPPSLIRLPGVPVISVDSVKYTDGAGQEQEITDFEVDLTAEPAMLWTRNGWPSMRNEPARMRIEYTAGYVGDVPDIIKQWILIKVADYYAQREGVIVGTAVANLSHVQRMLDNMRVMW